MANPSLQSPSNKSMTILSRMLLLPRDSNEASPSMLGELSADVHNLSRAEFDDLAALAGSNHVLVRGLIVLSSIYHDARDDVRGEWAQTSLSAERARIRTALGFLHEICGVFEEHGYDLAVIKSLDHWPDLGSDLDLYTNTNPEDVFELLCRRFHGKIASQSWGDRLACKWNFVLPGLPEAVEIHMGRLGQTGEQAAIASRLMDRSRLFTIGTEVYRVPSASDRLLISTLQRMYRHFYFRLCDIVDTLAQSEAGQIDYTDLRSSAEKAGIWEGVATYLVIVSDYVRRYRGTEMELPQFVREEAQFGGEEVYYRRSFLRVPIVPQSIRLYGTQLGELLRRRELQNGARLSLLPWLATAALVGEKITGSDKGIW